MNKKDIESLGFKQSNLDKEIFISNNKYDINGLKEFYPIGINFREYTHRCIIFWIIGNNPKAFPNLFVGYMRTKEELEILIKQINFNE